jgi:hypothetical protein
MPAAAQPSSSYSGGAELKPHHKQQHETDFFEKENSMTNVTLALNDAEQQAFHQLLDAALRQSGLGAIDVVSHFMGRIIAAQGASTQAQGGSQKPMQAQPAVPLQSAAAVSPAQPHASQSGPAPSVTAPSSSAPVNNTAANHNSNVPAQHESVLRHLIGEITGAAQAHPATRSTASAAAPNSVAAPAVPLSGAAPAANVAQAPASSAGTALAATPSLPAATSAASATATQSAQSVAAITPAAAS